MLHKYLYIPESAAITDATRFYFVTVGHGKQSDRDYLFLLAHAAQHGHYFELFSGEVPNFLMRCLASISPEPLAVPVHQVKIRDLVRAIKHDAAVPVSDGSDLSRHRLLNYLNTNYCLTSKHNAL